MTKLSQHPISRLEKQLKNCFYRGQAVAWGIDAMCVGSAKRALNILLDVILGIHGSTYKDSI
jgi:hypothetical protein